MEKPELSDIRYQRVNDDGTLSKDLELFIEDLEEWAGEEYERGFEDGREEGFDNGYESGWTDGNREGYDSCYTEFEEAITKERKQ